MVGAQPITRVIGETVTQTSIPERAIYLPNHPFKTGQKVTLKLKT